ncbi:uncharacterized protein LOC123327201 [Drosophila simulans]|uniref:uncharacterized protein LOC123327201 n=1 Tax=Drosophila simulans TaxID=7240 RepID=UPI001D100403|nr:uncharacterized protein LOC123327201 [Drosophila simulans]
MRLIQLNLNHCTAAQDLLVRTVRERRLKLALFSEPYRTAASPEWAFDRTKKAAIWRCSIEAQQLTDVLSDIGFVRARVGRWWVYSLYLAPSLTLIAFSRALDRLAADTRGRTQVLIAGDFNAWSESWGSSTINARGRMVLEAFATLDLALLNHGNRHTFRRAGLGSVVDLTFTSGSSFRLTRWRLNEDYTGSDHLPIISDLGCPPSSQAQIAAQTRIKYKTDTLDTQVFREQFLPTANRQGAELTAVELMRQLKAACVASMQRSRTHIRQRAPLYWWNQEIKTDRRECLSARRRYQRARGAESFAERQFESEIEKCNQNIRAIEHWLSSMGLELAPEKTEAVLMSSRKAVETATVEVGTMSSS